MKKMSVLFMAMFIVGLMSTAAQAFEIEWNEWEVELKGFLKADASYDDSKTSRGNFVRWVEQEMAGNNHDDEFNVTANQSRLGFSIEAPEYRGIEVEGYVEIDFYGEAFNDGRENRPGLLLRHAYVEVEWDNFKIKAGQMSDTIAPLNPNTLNYTVLWWAGNPGYRRPGFTGTCTFGDDIKLISEVGFFRTVGTMTDAGMAYKTGVDAGFPTFQGRVAVQAKLLGDEPFIFGVSGHYGEEEVDFAPPTEKSNYASWSVAGDLTFPIFDFAVFTGEIWYGENLDAYFGGIGQGINTTWWEGIESTGGWGQLSLIFLEGITINLGGGVDAPVPSDLAPPTAGWAAREVNAAGYINFIVEITPHAQVGLEYSHWRTDYRAAADGDDNRVQLSLIFPF